jgi:hypothetical protein
VRDFVLRRRRLSGAIAPKQTFSGKDENCLGKLDKIFGQECKLYMGILFVDWKVKFVLGQNWFGLCLMFFQLGPKNDIR